MNTIDVATSYLRSGLCVLPAVLHEKRPSLPGWKEYRSHLPTERQVRSWFASSAALCVLAGEVSGHLEMIDFDFQGELFGPWKELVQSQAPGLFERLVIERSQSGGRHVVYRCDSPVPGNRKLAQRTIVAENSEPIALGGKKVVPRKVNGHFEATVTLIETRGDGGLFLCAPSPGYVVEQGAFDDIPVVDGAQHDILIGAARALTEVFSVERQSIAGSDTHACGRPGDDFNRRGDVREILRRHGWSLVRDGDNQYWRRPGKEQGWSATLKNNVLYVFSSGAAPFEPDRAYSPFSVYTLLEHSGDFAAAASALGAQGYGQSVDNGVDLSGLLCNGHVATKHDALPPGPPDPGPMPESLLRVPGFVSQVMDHCLKTAPYPNVALAFCGALALQAVLAGRKVRDEGDNRTNLYLLALAFSSVGKDWPRKVNTRILHGAGLVDVLGEKFASGEGIQDALFITPAMLFQTDEIDGLLQSISKARDARHESIMGTMLTMYSAANSIYPMRRKAGKEPPGVIDQPCLVVYGTAIPTHYYQALCERMLTNGFFARMLIVESGPRSTGQNPGIIDPPERVMETARWWSRFNPGTGNLENLHPDPQVVPATPEARELLTQSRLESEAEYARAESGGDPVGTTVWGRVPEQIRKLALLYAVSENHLSPSITESAVRWATAFMLHQTRRMLFMAGSHVADNPFHAECLKLLRKLREAPGQELSHSVLLKRMKVDSKSFAALIDTLMQQREIETVTIARAGWPLRSYRIPGVNIAGGMMPGGET